MAAPVVGGATRVDAAKAEAAPTRVPSSPPPRAVSGQPLLRLTGETSRPPLPLSVDMARLVRAPGAGQPVPAPVRAALEASFGVSLAPVRVHADRDTGRAVDALNARAVTYGRDVFLGPRERSSDLQLMGHEVAHVVQQQAGPAPQRAGFSPGGGGLEGEARSAGAAAGRGEAFAVRGRTAGPQPQGLFEGVAEWAEEKAWGLLNEYAPELAPIIREGPIAWIADKVVAAIEAVFDTVMAPIRAVSGVVEGLSEHFANLLAWLREAAAQIARGDCRAVTEAVERIQKVIDGLTARVFDRLQKFFDEAKKVFNAFKERFAAPAWEFITRFAGRAWERIKELASWIWDKTAPIRRILERAWTWIKNKLGIGEGPEGQDGILQWIQRKAEAIWEERIKPFVERFKKPLLVIAGILVAFSPAGPIVAVVAGAVGLVKGIQWLRQRLTAKDGVVEGRGELQNAIIPGIINAIRGVTGKLTDAISGILAKLNGVMAGFGELIAAVGGSIFRLALGLVQWLADQFKALVAWAAEKLTKVAEWFGNGLNRLIAFLQPVLDVLGRIGEVALDILKLPGLVLGALWKRIPACIRDPFVNFLITVILKRIPIFKQLTEVLPAIWSRLKATAMAILHKVFKEGDLAGAALELFKLVLDALAVPLELVMTIFAKAGAAIDLVLKDPVGFLINLLRTLKEGFAQFGKNALRHLANGFRDWLLGSVAAAGISAPKDFSLPAIFGFILDLLNITVNGVLERLEGRIGKERVAPIRKVLSALAKVWDWVSTLLNEGPQGVWNRVKEKAGDLWQTLLDGVIGWLITTITQKALAKLATMLDPSGIMAVVNSLIAVYKAIQSVVRYLKQILGIVHTVLDTVTDIAKGAIGGAANLLEQAMARAIPVILGFLANQVGLGDLGTRIREIVDVIRAKINAAIDWVIDKAVAAGGALLSFGKAVVGSVTQWWRSRKEFQGGDGAKHTLSFSGEGKQAELMIASVPQRYTDFIQKIKLPAGVAAKFEEARGKALAVAKKIDELRSRAELGGVQGPDILTHLETLAEHTRELLGATTATPPSILTYGTLGTDNRGTAMTAQVLSSNVPAGTPPTDEPKIWLQANRRPKLYVQGHLLNERLGGPGRAHNLTPITRSANANHEKLIEKFVKDVIKQGRVVSYNVVAVYQKHPERQSQVRLRDLLAALRKETPRDEVRITQTEEELKILDYEQDTLARALMISYTELEKKGMDWVPFGSTVEMSVLNTLPE